tara:strand:+ start:1187 stop:2209 length:1023 start_codon:yes stop_codon:yes gene_type:complete
MKSEIHQEKKKRCIFLTGASSGIGYQAVIRLLLDSHKLILPCRDSKTSKNLIDNLKKHLYANDDLMERVSAPILDLSDLNSVKQCANQLFLQDVTIDTLVLNAGLQYTGSKNPRLSFQNLELTFAVNHLGHQYLTELILPSLLKSTSPRVIITASDVHNPESGGGRIGKPASLGELKGIEVGKSSYMIDGNSKFDADKAYKDSKLCNILFARELYRRLKHQGISMPVIAWAPGLVIPRSNEGFFRYSRKYNELGQRIFSLLARDLLQITESPEQAGYLLKMLATASKYSSGGFSYLSNRVISPGVRKFENSLISAEASDKDLGKNLWEKSSKLISALQLK